jgi:deoxycytidylate deaminase
MCTKILVNAGFKHVYWLTEYRDTDHLEIFNQCNITNGDMSSLLDDYHLIKD